MPGKNTMIVTDDTQNPQDREDTGGNFPPCS